MDCNKEEALRARDLAEKKMESKDFAGARKVALKAKQLYPDLENISQILIVCDVHCASEHKLNGNAMDWYKVLQIELTANDTTIKKQYRKFALQLHPDKNQFPGAEAAFKLIGEAQRVLLDSLSRSRFDDMYRRVTMTRNATPSYNLQKVPMNFNSAVQRSVRPVFTNLNPQQHQQPGQSSQQGGRPTFWTSCTFCSFRYQYYREVLNRSLRCQNCNKPFIAYDVDMQGTTPATNSTPQTFGQQKYAVNQGTSNAGVGSQGNLNTRKTNSQPSEKKRSSIDTSTKPNGKRRKKKEEKSSECSDSIGSTDSEDDTFADNDNFPGVEKFSSNREENPRRSTRQKHQVSYKENVSDDDDDDSLKPSKRSKGNRSSSDADESCPQAAKVNYQYGSAADTKDDQKEVKGKHSEESLVNGDVEIKETRGKEAVDGSKTDKASESTSFVFPDPEFNDFEKKEECFEVGQIWAIFDTADGMPRFYAIIRKVFSQGFKVRITWLEADPDEDDEIHWLNVQLPIACGKFKLGATDTTKDHLMFSHLICCERIGRSTFIVYPRKGETWALFKNWDIKWYMDVKSHQQYDYEFVQILSDYVEGEGVAVAYLAKLKDFVSLFSRIMKEGKHSVQIPSAELLKFSHRVPSFKMTGEERLGVPIGSYELDPASLPQNLEEVAVPEDVELEVGHNPLVGMSTKPDGDASTSKANLESSDSAVETKNSVDLNGGSAPPASSVDAFEIPDPQFFNFDTLRSPEKFQVEQIWAFYGDEDGLPKYYGRIKSVRTSPDFELEIKYLSNCWLPEDTIEWEDKYMIIACGGFNIKARGKVSFYNNTHPVSHQVHTSTDGKKKGYTILPRIGEFWALYRKWTPKLKCTDLEKMEYDIVQVVGETDLWIDISLMEMISGYSSVFKAKFDEGLNMTMRIPMKELLRFSHRIPAFKLIEACDNLRGCWELDPGAVPVQYFNSK
ncbi:putative DnaJ domain-containing protein [Lupinus albus]|uniref:Putative DnaJ domain-containing protein n=1 Tax=Lupinus albus TaxID=3870 RepID=A0A6A4NUL4_LUPAL|nr:putative DnaJ domain-containing protein [Lupinus albus]